MSQSFLAHHRRGSVGSAESLSGVGRNGFPAIAEVGRQTAWWSGGEQRFLLGP